MHRRSTLSKKGVICVCKWVLAQKDAGESFGGASVLGKEQREVPVSSDPQRVAQIGQDDFLDRNRLFDFIAVGRLRSYFFVPVRLKQTHKIRSLVNRFMWQKKKSKLWGLFRAVQIFFKSEDWAIIVEVLKMPREKIIVIFKNKVS